MPDIETLGHTKWDCKYHGPPGASSCKFTVSSKSSDLKDLEGAPGVSAGKCTVSVLNPSPQNHRSETIATPLGLMCPW